MDVQVWTDRSMVSERMTVLRAAEHDPSLVLVEMDQTAYSLFIARVLAEQARGGSTKRAVVHVSPRPPADPQTGKRPLRSLWLSALDLERERQAWTAGDYDVVPVPEDGREHPEGRPCPVCSADER